VEKPNKERSTEKIDAIVAAVMAVGRMQAGGQGDKHVAAARPSEVSPALSCPAHNVRLIENTHTISDTSMRRWFVP
jgi:hypothetical protein